MNMNWIAMASVVLCLNLGCGSGDEDLGDIDPCAPQQAQGEGQCDQALGAAWTGQQCVLVGGCNCTGADCDALFDTLEACSTSQRQCGQCSRDVECPDNGACVDGVCVWQ